MARICPHWSRMSAVSVKWPVAALTPSLCHKMDARSGHLVAATMVLSAVSL